MLQLLSATVDHCCSLHMPASRQMVVVIEAIVACLGSEVATLEVERPTIRDCASTHGIATVSVCSASIRTVL